MPDPILMSSVGPVGAAVLTYDGEPFGPTARLSDLVSQLVPDIDTGVLDYLELWPSALQRAIVAVLADAVENRVPLAFTWFPSTHFQLDVAQPERDGVTSLSAVIRSPYPADLRKTATT